jgi:transcriptional regulator with XRE-family HTH domain
VERDAQRNAREVRRAIGQDLRQAREDAGISLTALAAASRVPKSYLHGIEAGDERPSVDILARICSGLGGRVSIRFEASSGPRLRDHLQAAMIGSFLEALHPRWRRFVEVGVQRPVRGWIDLVTHDPDANVIVATEAHSQLRRIEQQVRWAKAKAEALQAGGSSELSSALKLSSTADVSRLLLLRSTRATRELARVHAELLAAAYPAPHEAAVEALCGSAAWPGPAIVWMQVSGGAASILKHAPRGDALMRRDGRVELQASPEPSSV